MMAELGRQPLRTRRGRAARSAPRGHCARSGTPGVGRHRARALPRRPCRRRRRARRVVDHLVDRKGRVVALRTPRGRRSLTVAAASLVVLYVGLTLGAQAVSAIGVGVAKAPADVTGSAYVGVRLNHDQLADRDLLAAIDELGVSVVIDAQTASHHSRGLDDLANHDVDIANGGWGKGTLLPWNQARNDLDKAGKVIAQEAGEPTREFVSARRLDAFDQFFSRRQAAARGAGPHRSVPRACPRSSRTGRSTCSTVATGTRWPWRSRSPTSRRVSPAPAWLRIPSGSSAEVEPPEARRDRGGHHWCRRVRRVHGTPALAGVSPIGVRLTPASRRCRPRRKRRADVRRRSRSGLDARVPRCARRAGLARHVLHAR